MYAYGISCLFHVAQLGATIHQGLLRLFQDHHKPFRKQNFILPSSNYFTSLKEKNMGSSCLHRYNWVHVIIKVQEL